MVFAALVASAGIGAVWLGRWQVRRTQALDKRQWVETHGWRVQVSRTGQPVSITFIDPRDPDSVVVQQLQDAVSPLFHDAPTDAKSVDQGVFTVTCPLPISKPDLGTRDGVSLKMAGTLNFGPCHVISNLNFKSDGAVLLEDKNGRVGSTTLSYELSMIKLKGSECERIVRMTRDFTAQ
jgi:hypothetical protein